MEKWRQVSEAHQEGGLKKALREVMFWLSPKQATIQLLIDEMPVNAEVLAELPGAAFVEIDDSAGMGPAWHKKVDRQVSKRFPERILVFRGRIDDSWYWPKKLSSGSVSYERLLTRANSLPDYLSQRLAGLSFAPIDFNDPSAVNPTSVREKIRGQFESSQVTETFYKNFKKKHEMLSNQILGLPSREASSSYATVLMNRLMFVYFLQKKEFLNSDPNYLTTCLSRLQELRGKDEFYSFYRDYLLEFFFNKLDTPGGKMSDPQLEKIAGDIPYINGGVFGQTEIEKRNNIKIPDTAFMEIFDFFDSYTWHLDTRPTGNSNEINPEVIGFIFEQYINFTASGKKENGAYYTKPDVTGYMVAQTLLPRIVSELADLGIPVFGLVTKDPKVYIHNSQLHGYDEEINNWRSAPEGLLQCWEGDPIGWSLLDEAPHDDELCLPGEKWVEMFNRREKVDELVEACTKGQLNTTESLVTWNLDIQKLVEDSISTIKEKSLVEELWRRLTQITVLDPTCGSGAFLFTSMEILEDVYSSLLNKLDDLGGISEISTQANSHPNRRYFIRKHIAIRNLYGTDIMDDAVETAKLRIFLSLASCLESKNQLEPLPDLDFNLKVGNIAVGFIDSQDVARVSDGKLIIENRLANIEAGIDSHIAIFEEFRNASENNKEVAPALKQQYKKSETNLRSIANDYYAECTNQLKDDYADWAKEVKPFHWSIEFPEVMSRGGFDVVVGNPPYISKKDVPRSTRNALVGFRTSELPDFYAVCLERTQKLLGSNGNRAMIVMLSFSFSPGFNLARKLYFCDEDKRVVWLATFGKRPDSLFRGIQVVNTILIDHRASENKSWATSHNIFSQDRRPWMFDALTFSEMAQTEDLIPIRAGSCAGIFTKFTEGTHRHNLGGQNLYLRKTSSYWLSVLPINPPVLRPDFSLHSNESHVSTVTLWEDESKELSCALLGSKIGYLWWSSIGDDLNSQANQTVVPRLIAQSFRPSEELLAMASKVLSKANLNWFAFNKFGSLTLNIRWNEIGIEMEEFTRQFLTEAGLAEYWRPLNIWYRKTMLSSGAGNSVYDIPKDLVESFISKGQLDGQISGG